MLRKPSALCSLWFSGLQRNQTTTKKLIKIADTDGKGFLDEFKKLELNSLSQKSHKVY